MRITIIIAALIYWCAPAASMTIELERRFGSELALEEFTILSSTDIELFAPVIEEFVAKRPNIAVHYVLASSRDIYSAIDTERSAYDLVISSAMDLQMKLVNDGHAGRFESPVTASLPDWAKWRDQLFGFAVEPIVLVVSRRDFAALPIPTSRRHFLSIIRSNSATFRNRMMTYDVNISGTGFLFATQDARQSDTFWRLSEVMGAMGTRLSCCSGEMLARIESGEIAAAYNVVGSYAQARAVTHENIKVVHLEDYTNILLRTAFIPRQSQKSQQAGKFLNFLLSSEGQVILEKQGGLPSIFNSSIIEITNAKPIGLNTGLLVYLDRLKRENFLREWNAALVQ